MRLKCPVSGTNPVQRSRRQRLWRLTDTATQIVDAKAMNATPKPGANCPTINDKPAITAAATKYNHIGNIALYPRETRSE